MSDTPGPERISPSFFEELGMAACATPGCPNEAMRLRVSGREMPTFCAACTEEAERREVEQAFAERVNWLYERSGRTALLDTWSLDSYPTDEPRRQSKQVALGWIETYLNTDPKETCPSLLLFGRVGSGKTGLAWGIVRRLVEAGIEARLVNFPELLDRMRDAFRAGTSPMSAFNAASVPVLVLDDVGAERPTEWATGELLLLIDRRKQRRLPTVYTSNYEPDELVERLGHQDKVVGERIVSRMSEGAIQHRMSGRDLRVS